MFKFILIKLLTNKFKNIGQILLHLLFLITSIVNAYIVVILEDILETKFSNTVFFVAAVSVFLIISYFFPSYNYKKSYLHVQLPISKFKRTIIEIGIDAMNLPFYFLLFIFVLFLLGNYYFVDFFSISLVFVTIHYIVRLIQSIKIISKTDRLFTLLTICSIIIYSLLFKPFSIALNLLALLFFLIVHIWNEQKKVVTLYNNYHNKFYMISLFLSYIFKSFMILFLVIMSIKSTNNAMIYIAILISVTPSLLFTYVYDNSLGYFPKIFLNLIYFGNNRHLILKYLKFMSLPFIIDIVLSFICAMLIPEKSILIGIIYITASVLMIPTGLLLSLSNTKIISQKISFNSNNPFLSQLVIVSIAILTILPYFKLDFFYIYFLFPIYLYVILKYLYKNINSLKNKALLSL